MMMNQNQNPGGPSPSMNMNQYQYPNPGGAPAPTPMQTNVPTQRLPYHADGWRGAARGSAVLHLILAILSSLVAIALVIQYIEVEKKDRGGILSFIVLFPFFELTAAFIFMAGTSTVRTAENPRGAMTKTVIWLMMTIDILLEKFFFVSNYPLFIYIDESYVLFTWNILTFGLLVICFGVGVCYAMAMHDLSKSRNIAVNFGGQQDWQTVVPGMMNINPNLVTPMVPFTHTAPPPKPVPSSSGE